MNDDTGALIGVALGCSAGTAICGALVVQSLRRRSIVVSIVAVAAVATVSLFAGVAGATELMVINAGVGHALLVALLPSAVVAACAAVLLGRRVSAGARALSLAAGRIGGDSAAARVEIAPAELAMVARQLELAHQRIADGRDREAALENSRRELVAWMSHDLRTPLAGIRAMAEALEDGIVDDAATVGSYHVRLRVESDRLAGMIDDLFQLAQLQAAAIPLTLQDVDLADLVDDALAASGPVARRKGVRLDGSAAPVQVQADPAELGRVIRNLVVNAIRHTPHDGTVWVEARADDDSAWLTVRDGCGGIPAADLPRVFDVAFRGTSARTPDQQEDGSAGAGLGLAIAKGIVEAHRGSIRVENSGPGCHFVVHLPRRARPPEPAPAPAGWPVRAAEHASAHGQPTHSTAPSR